MILQELLAGAEYTVNMYFDRDAHLRAAIPHGPAKSKKE